MWACGFRTLYEETCGGKSEICDGREERGDCVIHDYKGTSKNSPTMDQ